MKRKLASCNLVSDISSQPGAGGQSSSASAASGESPGRLLVAERESRELTLDEVADALNLSPQTVEWLETDNYAALPAAAFTQGYIRNYAKYIGLNPDTVVAAYQSKAGKPDVAWESPRGNTGITELVQRHPGLLISLVVAAVVLLIIIILFVVWPDDEGVVVDVPEIGLEVAPNRVSDEASVVVDEQIDEQIDERPSATPVAEASDALVPGAERASTLQDSVSTVPAFSATQESSRSTPRYDDPGSAIDRDAIDPNDPLAHLPVAKTYPAVSNRSEPSVEIAPDEPVRRADETAAARSTPPVRNNSGQTVSRRLTTQGSDLVRLEVAEDCWISIKNTAGKELYSALGREGQTYNLTGQGPFQVLLGYAPGAVLYFDGRQIQLEPYTRNNIARLVIGQ